MSNVKVEVKNLKQIKRDLERMKKAPQIVLDRTFSDVKQRGPSWIAKGVTERYGIKKKEILDGSVGQLKFQGDGIHNLQLEYSGRMLTPVHFNMRPISPPSPGNPYTIKATIYKGNRQTIGKIKKLTKNNVQILDVTSPTKVPGIAHSPLICYSTQATQRRVVLITFLFSAGHSPESGIRNLLQYLFHRW